MLIALSKNHTTQEFCKWSINTSTRWCWLKAPH